VDDLLVNEELLKEGLATVIIIEPNGMHSDIMFDAVNQAKKKKKGIWGNLKYLESPQRNGQFKVNLDKASRYEGKRVVVSGRVINTRKSDKVVVLNLDDKLDVVVFPDDLENFKHFGIKPENFYQNKQIEVIGRVKMHRGKPSIIVDHPMLIRSQR